MAAKAEITIDVRDYMTPAMQELAKKARNLSPAMKKIDQQVMTPLKSRAWAGSGLHSQSGELEEAVQTWHGKKSAGVALHTPAGRTLVTPKAVIHTEGAKAGKFVKKARRPVRAHKRGAVRVSRYTRSNYGAPRGDIPAREFIPDSLTPFDAQLAAKIIEEFIDV